MRRILRTLPFLLTLAAAPTSQPAPAANESRQIQSFSGDGLLRVRDASNKDGTPMVLYPQEAWKCMTWKFEAMPADGKNAEDFRLINHFTHKTCYPTSADAGTPITQHPLAKTLAAEERWHFTLLPDGFYRIDHVGTAKSLTLLPDHTIAIQPWTGTNEQKWKLLPKPEPFTG